MNVKIRVLVLGGVLPINSGRQQAANVITHEILSGLIEEKDFEIAYSVVTYASDPGVQSLDHPDVHRLQSHGIEFLPPIFLKPERRVGTLRRAVRWIIGDKSMIAGISSQGVLDEVVREWRPDVILTAWSELATAVSSSSRIPKVTYYGNPDHKTADARLRLAWENRRFKKPSLLAYPPIRRFFISGLRRAHLKVMRTQSFIGDVADNDARFYRQQGLNQATYLPNMWPSIPVDSANEQVAAVLGAPLKIVGSVGALDATGNTHGLLTIVHELLPRLKQRLGTGNFEIHIFGGRAPLPVVAKYLNDPHIKMRGFVDDLDAEIRSAEVFLVANNSTHFIVGHTRFLHAWSLGACSVGYQESALAMPELQNGRNVLLGSTHDEVVELIIRCGKDENLRKRIGAQAAQDLPTMFAPAIAVSKLAAELRAATHGSDSR